MVLDAIKGINKNWIIVDTEGVLEKDMEPNMIVLFEKREPKSTTRDFVEFLFEEDYINISPYRVYANGYCTTQNDYDIIGDDWEHFDDLRGFLFEHFKRSGFDLIKSLINSMK